jgi:hypothetical protein
MYNPTVLQSQLNSHLRTIQKPNFHDSIIIYFVAMYIEEWNSLPNPLENFTRDCIDEIHIMLEGYLF